MPRNEDGEFEVLLGNRQLLSVFFIMAVLLGAAFSMGYVVGRNSGSPANSQTAVDTLEDTDSKAAAATSNPVVRSETSRSKSAPSAPVAAAKQATSAQDRKPSPAPPPASEPKTSARRPTAASPTSAALLIRPAAGQTFLQVAAVERPEAEVVADVLRTKGFQAHIASHPTQPVFRVLVGPLQGPDVLADTRTDLETAGFRPIVRRY